MPRKKPEPIPKSIEEFQCDSEEKRLALTVNDVGIYPKLGIFNQAPWWGKEHDGHTLYHHDIRSYRALEQLHMLPLTYDGLKQFHDALDYERGRWSVLWASEKWNTHDRVYRDNFRRVVVFKSIELAIRPLQADHDIPRLILPRADAQSCLKAAMNAILAADPGERIGSVLGRASTRDPQDNVQHRARRVDFTFEWKFAHLPADMLASRVQKWRCKVFGGLGKLEIGERAFARFLRAGGFEDPRTDRKPIPPRPSRAKRPIDEMGASDELGPSSKRPTTGSQPESDSQSSVSSPEISRPPLLIAPRPTVMGPPPPMGPGQAGMNIQRMARQSRGRRGSRGSTSSASSRVGSRLAGLAVESPSEGSPEGVAPPPEGSAWGGHQGMARRDPAQFGGGYASGSQMPGHEYQGPGRVPQVPASGEFTEIYGHVQRVEPSRPRGPPRVGIPHTQFTDQGDWNPPQPGRQQVSAEQAPARRAHQYAGFEGAQSGSRYAYPPSSQSERQDDRSILRGEPLTESPQLQDLSEAEFEEGDIQPSFQAMPSLFPPAMHTRNPQTTLPPFGQNYPSSLPPSTQSAFADFIHWPEADDGNPSGFESEWEGEDDQLRVSYPHPPRSHPMQYLGSQDDGRTYYSTPEMGGGISAHENPYMGANRAGGDQLAHGDRFIGSYQPDEDQPVYEGPYWSASESD